MVEDLFDRLALPVDHVGENGEESDDMQATILGKLCFVYGGFISIPGLIVPNPLGGRACFLFCGLMIVAIGGLYRVSTAHERRQDPGKQAASI